MPMVRPCGELAHTSYGAFVPTPLGETAAKKYWPFHASAGRTRHKWGPDDSFCRSPVLLPVPWNYEAPGIVWFHIGGIYFKRRASLMR